MSRSGLAAEETDRTLLLAMSQETFMFGNHIVFLCINPHLRIYFFHWFLEWGGRRYGLPSVVNTPWNLDHWSTWWDVPDWVSLEQVAFLSVQWQRTVGLESLLAMLVNFCLLCLAHVSAHLTLDSRDSLTVPHTHSSSAIHFLKWSNLHVSSFSIFVLLYSSVTKFLLQFCLKNAKSNK